LSYARLGNASLASASGFVERASSSGAACEKTSICGKLAVVGHRRFAAEEGIMAKSQKKSNKEVRKPKADKAPKQNASNPSSKPATVGIVTIKG
jgi:hypothetical protein